MVTGFPSLFPFSESHRESRRGQGGQPGEENGWRESAGKPEQNRSRLLQTFSSIVTFPHRTGPKSFLTTASHSVLLCSLLLSMSAGRGGGAAGRSGEDPEETRPQGSATEGRRRRCCWRSRWELDRSSYLTNRNWLTLTTGLTWCLSWRQKGKEGGRQRQRAEWRARGGWRRRARRRERNGHQSHHTPGLSAGGRKVFKQDRTQGNIRDATLESNCLQVVKIHKTPITNQWGVKGQFCHIDLAPHSGSLRSHQTRLCNNLCL